MLKGHTRSAQNAHRHRPPTHGLLQDPLHPRSRAQVQTRLEQLKLAPAVRDRIAGPEDGAKFEWRRVDARVVEIVARDEVRVRADGGAGVVVR